MSANTWLRQRGLPFLHVTRRPTSLRWMVSGLWFHFVFSVLIAVTNTMNFQTISKTGRRCGQEGGMFVGWDSSLFFFYQTETAFQKGTQMTYTSLISHKGILCLVQNQSLAWWSRTRLFRSPFLHELGMGEGTLSPTNWISIKKGQEKAYRKQVVSVALPASVQQMAIRILSKFLSPSLYLTIRLMVLFPG